MTDLVPLPVILTVILQVHCLMIRTLFTADAKGRDDKCMSSLCQERGLSLSACYWCVTKALFAQCQSLTSRYLSLFLLNIVYVVVVWIGIIILIDVESTQSASITAKGVLVPAVFSGMQITSASRGSSTAA